jgi:hypothetical protein
MNNEPMEPKKTWTTPDLTVYGKVEDITLVDPKSKLPSMADDFGVTGNYSI